MCKCSVEDVHNYGPCGEDCDSRNHAMHVASLIEAVRLENAAHGKGYEKNGDGEMRGFSDGVNWALDNLKGRAERADQLHRLMNVLFQ